MAAAKKSLLAHVLLCADKCVVADMDPSAVGAVDIGDGEKHQRDEDSKEKDLECVKARVRGAKHRSGSDGKKPANEENSPEDSREPIFTLEQTGATMFGESTEL